MYVCVYVRMYVCVNWLYSTTDCIIFDCLYEFDDTGTGMYINMIMHVCICMCDSLRMCRYVCIMFLIVYVDSMLHIQALLRVALTLGVTKKTPHNPTRPRGTHAKIEDLKRTERDEEEKKENDTRGSSTVGNKDEKGNKQTGLPSTKIDRKKSSKLLSLLQTAQDECYAIAAFNVYNLEGAKAVVAAAEQNNSPVILQVRK